MQWQHGSYVLASDGSLTLIPIAVDGRQLLSEPCTQGTGIYTRYNNTEHFKVSEDILRFCLTLPLSRLNSKLYRDFRSLLIDTVGKHVLISLRLMGRSCILCTYTTSLRKCSLPTHWIQDQLDHTRNGTCPRYQGLVSSWSSRRNSWIQTVGGGWEYLWLRWEEWPFSFLNFISSFEFYF